MILKENMSVISTFGNWGDWIKNSRYYGYIVNWREYPGYIKLFFLILGLGTVYLFYGRFTREEPEPLYNKNISEKLYSLRLFDDVTTSKGNNDIRFDHLSLLGKILSYYESLMSCKDARRIESLAFHWGKNNLLHDTWIGDKFKRNKIQRKIIFRNNTLLNELKEEKIKDNGILLRVEEVKWKYRKGIKHFKVSYSNSELSKDQILLAQIQLTWITDIYNLLTESRNSSHSPIDIITEHREYVLNNLQKVKNDLTDKLSKLNDEAEINRSKKIREQKEPKIEDDTPKATKYRSPVKKGWIDNSRKIQNMILDLPVETKGTKDKLSDLRLQRQYMVLLEDLVNWCISTIRGYSDITMPIYSWGLEKEYNLLRKRGDFRDTKYNTMTVFKDAEKVLSKHKDFLVHFGEDEDKEDTYRLGYDDGTESDKKVIVGLKNMKVFREQILVLNGLFRLFVDKFNGKDSFEGNPNDLLERFGSTIPELIDEYLENRKDSSNGKDRDVKPDARNKSVEITSQMPSIEESEDSFEVRINQPDAGTGIEDHADAPTGKDNALQDTTIDTNISKDILSKDTLEFADNHTAIDNQLV